MAANFKVLFYERCDYIIIIFYTVKQCIVRNK